MKSIFQLMFCQLYRLYNVQSLFVILRFRLVSMLGESCYKEYSSIEVRIQDASTVRNVVSGIGSKRVIDVIFNYSFIKENFVAHVFHYLRFYINFQWKCNRIQCPA